MDKEQEEAPPASGPSPQTSGPGARDPFRRIVWPLAIAETIVWAAMFYSFPALILTWERDLGWSKTELSGAFTLSLVVSALMAPLVGRLDRPGLPASGLRRQRGIREPFCWRFLSLVTEPWHFYVVWVGLGAAMSGSLYEACFAVLTHVMGSACQTGDHSWSAWSPASRGRSPSQRPTFWTACSAGAARYWCLPRRSWSWPYR